MIKDYLSNMFEASRAPEPKDEKKQRLLAKGNAAPPSHDDGKRQNPPVYMVTNSVSEDYSINDGERKEVHEEQLINSYIEPDHEGIMTFKSKQHEAHTEAECRIPLVLTTIVNSIKILGSYDAQGGQ
jgi:hypothetical protein